MRTHLGLIHRDVNLPIPVTALLFFALCAPAALAQSYEIASTNPAASPASDTPDRSIDGLAGLVKSVRTERAKLTARSRQIAESARVLLETVSYDRRGRRTSEAYYPVSGATLTGKEEYKYDDRGNITEMTLLGGTGRVLRREVYSYEFDAAGNWIKMLTSVASSPGGASDPKPAEVTYRTITYYAEDPSAGGPPQVASNAGASPAVPAPSTPNGEKKDGNALQAEAALADAAAPSAAPEGAATSGMRSDWWPPRVAPPAAREEGAATAGPQVSDKPEMKAGEKGLGGAASPAAEPTKLRISGGVLIGKALSLPEPDYPEVAKKSGIEGNVDVEIVIDEEGRVVEAHVASGHSVFRRSVIQAAYRARFTPTLLSGKPARASGRITYNFLLDSRPSDPADAKAASQSSPRNAPADKTDKTSPQVDKNVRGAHASKEQANLSSTAARPITPPGNTTPNAEADTNDPAQPAHITSAGLTAVYRIGPGDILDIRLPSTGTRELTLYTVTSGGLLDYPLAGAAFTVSGMTTEDLSARLSAELMRRAIIKKPEVLVNVREYVSHVVTVSGLVDQPGPKTLRAEAAPLYAVLANASPRAEAGRVVITGSGASESRVVDLLDPAAARTLVYPGDVLHVSARTPEFFYVGGEVRSPGRKEFYPGTTLTQALLQSEGLKSSSSRKVVVKISRQDPRGSLYSSEYRLADIEAGRVPDPGIRPGDRVIVMREP